MPDSLFAAPPQPLAREATEVMGRTTIDDLAHIEEAWPAFERLVGLRGRKMFATVDTRRARYTVCTPITSRDDPDALGLTRSELPGGSFLRGRMVGEPEWLYARIAEGIEELRAMVDVDDARPLVEYYRRREQVELWVPVRTATSEAAMRAAEP